MYSCTQIYDANNDTQPKLPAPTWCPNWHGSGSHVRSHLLEARRPGCAAALKRKHITPPLCQNKSTKPSRGLENLWGLRDDSNRMLSCTVRCWAVLLKCQRIHLEGGDRVENKKLQKARPRSTKPCKRAWIYSHKPSNHEHNDWPCKVISRGEPIVSNIALAVVTGFVLEEIPGDSQPLHHGGSEFWEKKTQGNCDSLTDSVR